MLDRSQRKRGPTTNTEKKLADMEHEAIARWIWQKNERKKRERKLNKEHNEYLEKQAAEELLAAQKALNTAQEEQEEYDYEGAYVKEEPHTEKAPGINHPVAGPFNFVDHGEFHDFKQEPREAQVVHTECLPQANCDNSSMQTAQGSSALEDAALDANATENAGSPRTALENYPSGANLKKKSPCPVCSKELASTYMKQPMRVHTGKRQFKCDECGKRFTQLTAFLLHRAYVHSGERPLKCDKCSAGFVRQWDLTVHSKVHTSSGPIFPCKTCGRAFARNKARQNNCQALKPIIVYLD